MNSDRHEFHIDDATLSLYHDGEGPEELRLGLEAHLAECDVCCAKLKSLELMSRHMGSLPGLHAPPQLLANIVAEVEREASGGSAPAPAFARRWGNLAAGFLLASVVGLAWWSQQDSWPFQGLRESALAPGSNSSEDMAPETATPSRVSDGSKSDRSKPDRSGADKSLEPKFQLLEKTQHAGSLAEGELGTPATTDPAGSDHSELRKKLQNSNNDKKSFRLSADESRTLSDTDQWSAEVERKAQENARSAPPPTEAQALVVEEGVKQDPQPKKSLPRGGSAFAPDAPKSSDLGVSQHADEVADSNSVVTKDEADDTTPRERGRTRSGRPVAESKSADLPSGGLGSPKGEASRLHSDVGVRGTREYLNDAFKGIDVVITLRVPPVEPRTPNPLSLGDDKDNDLRLDLEELLSPYALDAQQLASVEETSRNLDASQFEKPDGDFGPLLFGMTLGQKAAFLNTRQVLGIALPSTQLDANLPHVDAVIDNRTFAHLGATLRLWHLDLIEDHPELAASMRHAFPGSRLDSDLANKAQGTEDLLGELLDEVAARTGAGSTRDGESAPATGGTAADRGEERDAGDTTQTDGQRAKGRDVARKELPEKSKPTADYDDEDLEDRSTADVDAESVTPSFTAPGPIPGTLRIRIILLPAVDPPAGDAKRQPDSSSPAGTQSPTGK